MHDLHYCQLHYQFTLMAPSFLLIASESLLCVGQIPVLSINYTVLSNGTSYSRDTVELCIREILVAFGKALGASKDINLDFPKIGRLMVRDKKCRMRFFKEFIRSIDSSGKINYAFVSHLFFTIINVLLFLSLLKRVGKSQDSEGSVMSDPASAHRTKALPKYKTLILQQYYSDCHYTL